MPRTLFSPTSTDSLFELLIRHTVPTVNPESAVKRSSKTWRWYRFGLVWLPALAVLSLVEAVTSATIWTVAWHALWALAYAMCEILLLRALRRARRFGVAPVSLFSPRGIFSRATNFALAREAVSPYLRPGEHADVAWGWSRLGLFGSSVLALTETRLFLIDVAPLIRIPTGIVWEHSRDDVKVLRCRGILGTLSLKLLTPDQHETRLQFPILWSLAARNLVRNLIERTNSPTRRTTHDM